MAVGPDKCHLERGIGFLDLAQKLDVAGKPDRGSKQDEEFVVLANLDSLPPVDPMRRGVHQPATGNQSGRIRQPDGVPVGLNLARRRPARTCPAVEVLKTWRVQQHRFHDIWHSSPSASRRILQTNLRILATPVRMTPASTLV